MTDKKFPKWVTKYVSEWRERLYLHEWEVQTSLSPHPNEDGGGSTRACVSLYPDVRLAKIEFRDDIPADLATADEGDALEWKKTIVHELLHIRLAAITEMVTGEIIPELSPSAGGLADRLFHRAVEPTVDLLSQTLIDLTEDG